MPKENIKLEKNEDFQNNNGFKEFKKTARIVLILAIPVIIESISQTLMGIVDMYFVGKLGTEAIASVGITNTIMNVYIAFFIAVGIGTTAIISRAIGAKKFQTAKEALQQSVTLAIIIGVIIGIINFLFSKNILLLLGTEIKVMEYAVPYFRAVAVPAVFLSMMISISSAYRGAGDTRTPMKIALMANVVNIVLDYILIFGILNFTGLGILGAGLATTISRVGSTVFLIVKLNRSTSPIKSNIFKNWHVDKKMFKSIINIGIPAGIEKLFMRVGQLVYVGLIIKIGTDAYAVHTIGGTIQSLSFLPGMGFAVAAATLVGQNLGANEHEKAMKYGMVAYALGAMFMATLGIIFFFFGEKIASLFIEDPVITELVGKVLKIVAFSEPFGAMTIVITAALQGAGETKFPMFLTFAGIWIFRVLGIYILGIKLHYGIVGAWIAISVDIIVRGCILMIRFRKGKWKDIKILD